MVNRLFILTFDTNDNGIEHSRYFLSTAKVKHYYNIMIDGENFFDQPIENDIKHMKTFEKLQLVKEMITQLVDC